MEMAGYNNCVGYDGNIYTSYPFIYCHKDCSKETHTESVLKIDSNKTVRIVVCNECHEKTDEILHLCSK